MTDPLTARVRAQELSIGRLLNSLRCERDVSKRLRRALTDLRTEHERVCAQLDTYRRAISVVASNGYGEESRS